MCVTYLVEVVLLLFSLGTTSTELVDLVADTRLVVLLNELDHARYMRATQSCLTLRKSLILSIFSVSMGDSAVKRRLCPAVERPYMS